MENVFNANEAVREICENVFINQDEKVEELYKWMIEEQNRICSGKEFS